MSDLKPYSAVIGGIAIRWCPKCQIYNSGNYCNICGGKLEEKKPMEKECPCCGGSGKIPYYPHPSIPMYTYMNYNRLTTKHQQQYKYETTIMSLVPNSNPSNRPRLKDEINHRPVVLTFI